MSKNSCVIYAPVDTLSGYGSRSRDTVKSIIELKKEEWDIKIIPCAWGNTPIGFIDENPEWHFLIPHLFTGPLNSQPDIFIWITIPSEFQRAGKFNIGITAGIETTAAPADWIEGINRMDLTLVSSEHSKKAFLDAQYQKINKNTQQVEALIKVEKPIEVLFEGVDTNIYKFLETPDKTVGDLNTIPEEFCYLFVGHWLQGDLGEDRKNVGYLIKAFLEVFKNKQKKPALILKTSMVGPSYMDRDEILKRIHAIKATINSNNLPNIYLLHGEFTDIEMNELYNHSKVKAMVSLTKGEGVGRPLLEFSLTKKPIIASNWSGHIDFLHPKNNILLGGNLTQVHPSIANQFLLKESAWFSVNPAEVGEALTNVHKYYSEYLPGARKQGEYNKEKFSFEAMKEVVNEQLIKVPEFPTQVQLKLPQLKKIELPKLNKV